RSLNLPNRAAAVPVDADNELAGALVRARLEEPLGVLHVRVPEVPPGVGGHGELHRILTFELALVPSHRARLANQLDRAVPGVLQGWVGRGGLAVLGAAGVEVDAEVAAAAAAERAGKDVLEVGGQAELVRAGPGAIGRIPVDEPCERVAPRGVVINPPATAVG